MSRHRRDWSTAGILEPAPRDTEGRLQGSLGSKSHVNLELCGWRRPAPVWSKGQLHFDRFSL